MVKRDSRATADRHQEKEQRGVKGPDLLDITINDKTHQHEAISLTDMRASLSAILDIVNEIRQTQLLQQQDSGSLERTIVPQSDDISATSSMAQMDSVQDVFQTASSPLESLTNDRSTDNFQVYPHFPNTFPSSFTHEEAVASAITQLLPAIETLIDKKLKPEDKREDSESRTQLENNLTKQLQEDKARISQHTEEPAKLAHAETKLQAKNKQNEHTIANQQEIEQARRELSEYDKENKSLHLQLSGVQEDPKTAVSEKEELRQALMALQTQMELNNELKEVTANLHKQQENELRQELTMIQSTLTQMEMQIQMKERELDETCREKEQECQCLKQQLTQTVAENKVMKSDRDKLQELCSATVISRDQTQLQLQTLEHEAAETRRQLLDAKEKYDQCESHQSQVKQTLQNVQRQLNEAERELTESKSQSKSKEINLQDAVRQLNQKRAKLNETEIRLLSVEQTNSKMQMKLTATMEAEFQLQTEIVQLQASNHAQEKLAEEWMKQLAANKNEITELRKEKEKYQIELKSAEEELKKQIEKQFRLENRMQETEGSLAALTDREKMLKDQLGSAIQRAKEKESEMVATMDALQTRNVLLQEKLASKDASLVKSAHTHADTSGRMQQLSKELERVQQELSQQRETTMKQQADMIKQQTDYQQVVHKLKKREENIQNMENKKTMLHQTNDILLQRAKEESSIEISREKEKLEKLLQQMQSELLAKGETLNKAENAVTSLQSEMLHLQRKVTSQEGEVLACQVNLAQSTRQLQEVRTHNEQLTADLRTVRAERNGLMEQNEQLQASCNELRADLQTVTQDKEKSDEKAETMEIAFEEERMKSEKLAQEYSNVTTKLEGDLQERQQAVSDLNKEINGHVTEIAALKQANSLQQMQLDQTTVAHDDVKAQLDKETSRMKAEADRLRDELHSQKEESLMNRTTAAELQNHLGMTRQNLAQAGESMERQQEVLRSEADARQKLEAERRKLKEQLDQEEEKTAQLEEQNREVQSALAKTHQQLSELSKRLEQAQTTSKTWKAELEEKDVEVNKLSTDKHKAVDENSELQRCLYYAESNQRRLEEEMRAQSDRADQLQGTVEKLNDELQEAIRLREENEKARSVAVAKIKSLASRNQDVERTIEQLTAIQNSLQQSVAQANEEKDKMVTALESRIEVLKRDVEKKTEALESQATSENQLRRKLKVAEDESKRAGQLFGQLSELQAKLINAETSLEQSTRELTEIRTNAAVLQGERDQLMVILRDQGIQKHTEKPSTPAAMKRLRAGTASKQDVLVLLKDKDEEAQRLKEYVDKLLSAVIDQAPFVLEAIK
ncbi:myosin heavy chain, cardiac muscle isoform-like [Corticium candelabrum]|uniref:myosin heavy chain, cardiac muscle isoform-like n=1 Tax=Corticium candelabrum TaxID=121492 RepID=UPI002E2629FB|nr:myosin heavy chain, cardiac muscle isoform-like [Corticium candelabrum]